MEKRDLKKGSVILPTVLVVIIIISVGGTYLTMAFHEFKMTYRNMDLQKAINIAEAGVEDAMAALKNDNWEATGWTKITTDHYYISGPLHVGLGHGSVGHYKVYASVLDEDAPIIFSEGVITSPYGMTKKQIRLDFGRKGLFANGLTAKDSIDWSGNNVSVDSYDSDDGDYDPTTNKNDQGSVASLSIIDGAISPGNGDILGYVATGGGAAAFGPNGTLKGFTTPPGIDIDPERIAYDFYANFPYVSAPTPTLPATTLPASGTIGIPSATNPSYYKVPSFSNQNSDTLVIDGPIVVIVDGDWDTKGEIQITTNGSLEIYIEGDMDIGGKGAMNLTNIPSKLFVVGTDTVLNGQTIKMSGNGALKAAIYAPNANLEMKGGGNSGVFMGAAVAYKITMTGTSNFHYDEALGNFAVDSKYKVERWRELIGSDEKVPLDQPNQMLAHAVSLP